MTARSSRFRTPHTRWRVVLGIPRKGDLDGWVGSSPAISVCGMTSEHPSHLAASLRRRGWLISAWPWRALAYLVSTVPIAGVLAVGLLVIGAPLLPVVSTLRRQGRPPSIALMLFLITGSIILVVLAPLLSVVVGAVERWRVRLVDNRPLPSSPWPGLAARYRSAATWREVAYLFWLGGFVPVAYWVFLVLVLLDVGMVTSPWLAGDNEPVVIWQPIDSTGEAVPYAIVGVLLLPVLCYGVGLLAAGQAAVARWALTSPVDAAALREVARSRTRLVGAYEAERRRIERDLHDGAQPRLTSLTLQLGLARLDVPEDSPAARPLAVAHDQARGLMVMLRQLVHGIRPQSLTDLGLAGAVRELADAAPVAVTVHADVDGALPEIVETTAYFVVSEALSNVARHSGATGAGVRLSRVGGDLVVEVSDDGHGGADPARGTGLTGLADRVAAAEGRLLLSSPPGGPTLVRVELPCRR
ncbi:Two-component histidine kinase dimerization and phosphoacceptor region [Micromonospora lupini str. Lupac 08]|uniref:histidine kinase n=2 Tax=Micromonospora lupini TaxID=285679 RepID=I0L066_9ACTN|nr:Two-component histidine kinase dimerization and phosphoacceptor region [Micromonospora lupini str. Lupac 08]